MKREILFRGKRIDNGEWVYGFYYEFEEKYFIMDHTLNTQHISNVTKITFEIDASTLSQFTGLTDKNGTRIFEGDIVRYFTSRHTRGIKATVEWDDSGMWIPFRDDEHIQDEQGDWIDYSKGFEVTGNIHD